MVIYLIEDDEIQAQYYQSILAGHGWKVKILLDGERAFREIHRMTPDLVILDRRLPDLDGLEVLAWIRKNHATVPVLILTNAVLESDVVTALEAGADDYVIKPPREQEFVARVKALYRRSREIHTRPELMEIGHIKSKQSKKQSTFIAKKYRYPPRNMRSSNYLPRISDRSCRETRWFPSFGGARPTRQAFARSTPTFIASGKN